jgi:hypothetical protein
MFTLLPPRMHYSSNCKEEEKIVILESSFPSLGLNTVFLNFNIKSVKVMKLIFIFYVQHNVVITGGRNGAS